MRTDRRTAPDRPPRDGSRASSDLLVSFRQERHPTRKEKRTWPARAPPRRNPAGGSVASLAIWADDGRKLAAFYAAALGREVGRAYPDEQGDEVAFTLTDGGMMYVFSTSKSFTAPNWPADELTFRLDLTFADVPAAEKRLLELGATKPDFQPGGKHWTVLLDPSGQPFCVSGRR
ncbi:VOC family protein [Streptomyces sp. ISL-11]|uniref:VOC family protein n=1 Tax=Streptomyces sp. ISL-11 TaxID=2819174 RepID=UPI001BECF819|nr:VOC family protein [Streptomyces sp. ISL-11]MBT2387638.1 VOC family protein [Streptomyces sp. ISL-11]